MDPAASTDLALVVGLQLKNTEANLKHTLEGIHEHGYQYICTQVQSPKIVASQVLSSLKQAGGERNDEGFHFLWRDLQLSKPDWKAVVGVVSDLSQYLRLPGADDVRRKAICRRILTEQLAFCVCPEFQAHAVLIEPSYFIAEDFTNLADIVSAKLKSGTNRNIWIKVPMNYEKCNPLNETCGQSPWNAWNTFRTCCSFDYRLFPVLQLGINVPTDDEITRWIGEPVKAIFISTKVFGKDNKLSLAHQDILKRMFKLTQIQVVIEAEKFCPDLKQLQFYIRSLFKKFSDKDPDYKEIHGVGSYADRLLVPLQPLRDDLHLSFYDIFQKDPVKYVLYEKAIYQALIDKVPSHPKETTIVMVVGAGKGPLVTRSLAAADKAKRNIHVYAVEKNTKAKESLLALSVNWGDKVTIVFEDMRYYKPPDKADVIVSELIGSFSDNELSPECLDGAQQFLKPNGVMIPKSYTSFVSPIMAPKYHQELQEFTKITPPRIQPYEHFESLHVVQMFNKYIIAPPKKLFHFEHPRSDLDACDSNDRNATLQFTAEKDCLLNGFAGYFECKLYGDVIMSILPSTFSLGMFSWNPIFIPLREPVYLSAADVIKANFWRKHSETAVWYEWSISSPKELEIHNPDGKFDTIGLGLRNHSSTPDSLLTIVVKE